MEFIAESVPAYMVERDGRRPMTDEDIAMSAPEKIAVERTLEAARTALSGYLKTVATYNHVIRRGEVGQWLMAAEMVMQPGCWAIKIDSRYYRVRAEKK